MRFTAQDLQSLTDAIYAEARGESLRGMRAVGHTIVNRANVAAKTVTQAAYARNQITGLMPGNVNRKALENVDINDPAYQQSLTVATNILTGKSVSPVGEATFYHTKAVNPHWNDAPGFDKAATVGSHYFYTAPAREVRANMNKPMVSPIKRDESFTSQIVSTIDLPVDFETGEFIVADATPYDPLSSVEAVPATAPTPPSPPVSFTDYAGMAPADQRIAGQVERMTPEGQALLDETNANLSRMAGLGYDVPGQATITSGMRTVNTDRRTHPTGGAFDLRTRDMTPEEVRSTSIAALAGGAKGLGVFDGATDRFPTHMHVDTIGAWGPDTVLGSAVPDDIRNAARGAGVAATGQKLAEGLDAGINFPDGTVSADFVQMGTIPTRDPSPKPTPSMMAEAARSNSRVAQGFDVANNATPVPIRDGGFMSATAAEVPAADAVSQPQDVNVPAMEYAAEAAENPFGDAAVPLDAPETRMVQTQSFPMDDVAGRVDTAFEEAEQQQVGDRVAQAFDVANQATPEPQPGAPGIMAAQAAPAAPVAPSYDPLGSVVAPQAPAAPAPAQPAYDPLGSVALPPEPAPPVYAPTPTPRPDVPVPAPEMEAPIVVPEAPPVYEEPAAPEEELGAIPEPYGAPVPNDVYALTGDPGIVTPKAKPEPDTTMGNIVGQGFGAVGGGIMGGIPGALMGRKVGGAIGRGLSSFGIGAWMDDVVKPDPRMEAGIEAGWSSPDGDLNGEWDDGRYWSELSKNGYTRDERGMQMAMAREQRERAAAGQKTWADAFGINQDTSVFDAGKNALKNAVADITEPITKPIRENVIDPIKENITIPAREAWENNVTEPIKNNITGPIKDAISSVTDPIKDTAKSVTQSVIDATTSPTPGAMPTPPTDPNQAEAEEAVSEAVDSAKSEAASQSQSTQSESSSSSDGDGGGSGNPNEDGGSDDGGASSRNVDGSIGGLYSLEYRKQPKVAGVAI